MTDRNPTILFKAENKRPACPKCGHPDFSGRNIGGVVTFTCKKDDCRNQWSGGLPQLPQDPTKPLPPEPPNTSGPQYVKNNDPNIQGDVIEVLNRPSLVPSFRRGAPIPEEEE